MLSNSKSRKNVQKTDQNNTNLFDLEYWLGSAVEGVHSVTDAFQSLLVRLTVQVDEGGIVGVGDLNGRDN